MACAWRAGHQPPAMAEAVPSAPKTSALAQRPAQRRHDAGEVTPAQVARQEAQGRCRQRRAAGQADQAAGRAQPGTFQQHPGTALARRQAQHAQQGKRRCALRDRQRDHRKHQEGADEQGHQGQHREVDAVGTRQVGDTLLGFVGRHRADIRRQGQARQQGRGVGARRQPQVDARELAHQAQVLLRTGQVHHQHGRAASGHAAGHAQRDEGRAGLQRDGVAVAQAQPFARQRIGEHQFGVQKGQPVLARRGSGQQGRRQWHGQQCVDAQNAHRHPLAIPCPGVGVDLPAPGWPAAPPGRRPHARTARRRSPARAASGRAGHWPCARPTRTLPGPSC
jgi:hypothetical protein